MILIFIVPTQWNEFGSKRSLKGFPEQVKTSPTIVWSLEGRKYAMKTERNQLISYSLSSLFRIFSNNFIKCFFKIRNQSEEQSSNLWLNLHDVGTTFHRYRLVGEYTLKVIKKLLCLAGAKVRISILIAPDKGSFFFLNCGSISGFSVQLHHRLCNLLPTTICYRNACFPLLIPLQPETRCCRRFGSRKLFLSLIHI